MKVIRKLILICWAAFAVLVVLFVAKGTVVLKFVPPLVIAYLVLSLLKGTFVYGIARVYSRNAKRPERGGRVCR